MPLIGFKRRLEDYLAVLANYPRIGLYRADHDVWEAWVPQTKLIVWYRFDDAQIDVLVIWHSSQDRR